MMYREKYQAEVTLFVTVCQRLAHQRFVTAYGGNAAWKLDDDILLITPTQTNKGDVTDDDVVFIAHMHVANEAVAQSMETDWGKFRAFDEISPGI